MMSIAGTVAQHYGRDDVARVILEALAAAGKDTARLTIEDLAPIDEFHVRGRAATAELAGKLELVPGMAVLDLGCGIGGASRYLALTHGCRVTGIDLTEPYCRTAAILSERLGLGDRLEFRHGDALAMPFADAAFDAALTQHAAMNIENKAGLYAEVARVLRPGGRFGIYDLLQGAGGEVLFPVAWARDRSISFLVAPGELRDLLEAAGFEIVSWREPVAEARAWVDQVEARMAEPQPPPSALRLLLGSDPAPMAQNLFRNLREGRVVPTEIVCRKR